MEKLPSALRKLLYRGFVFTWLAIRPLLVWLNRKANTYCPVCGNRSAYLMRRADAAAGELCPICFSRARHRFSWLFMTRTMRLDDFAARRFLHLAPEVEFTRRFKSIPGLLYSSADLGHPGAMYRLDLTAIDRPDASFDAIYCSHMLEHIPDDRQAMRELGRTLGATGWLLVQVPLDKNKPTKEDFSVVDPRQREREFGQWDHVRVYGMDIVDRLTEAGFDVRVWTADELLSAQELETMSVPADETLLLCTKATLPAGASPAPA